MRHLLIALALLAVPLPSALAQTLPASAPDWRYTLSIHDIARADDDERLTQLLTDNPDRTRSRTPDGRTPVHFAAEAGAIKALRVLAKYNADLNIVDASGRTPLSIAASLDYMTTVKTLAELGADINKDAIVSLPGSTSRPLPPVIIAARYGYTDLLKILLDNKADLNRKGSDGSYALTAAAAAGFSNTLKLLADRGANLNVTDASGQTALFIAARQGYADAVKVLLDAKADPNRKAPDGHSPITVATAANHVDSVKLLVAASAQLDATDPAGVTPLYIAAQKGYIDTLKVLLDARSTAAVDPNRKAPDGSYPITAAAAANQWEAVRLLADSGADLNLANTDGMTVLLFALQNPDDARIKFLLDKGANPSTQDRRGRAPLALTESPTLWKLLVDKGADVNILVNGATRLQTYIAQGKVDLLRTWLAFHPDPLSPDRKGMTAKELARAALDADQSNLTRREIARLVDDYQNKYYAELHPAAPN